MKGTPTKVLIALDSICNTLQSISDRKGKSRATELFFVFDAMLSFRDSILRAVGKDDYRELKAVIQSAMRMYAKYIDGVKDVKWETVIILARKAHAFVYTLTSELRE